MIEVEIVPCEPHRAFHGLILVHGLRRRPVSGRFSIISQEIGKPRYLGPQGWDAKFVECRGLAAGWDVGRKLLWLLVGPEVTLLLDQEPFTFTLLQTGEQVPELSMPASIREPGDGELPAIAMSGDRTSVVIMAVPDNGPSDVPPVAPPSRPRPVAAPAIAIQRPVIVPVAPPRVDTPHKDTPVRPVIIGIALVMGLAMGVAYLLTGGGSEPTSTAAAPSVAVTGAQIASSAASGGFSATAVTVPAGPSPMPAVTQATPVAASVPTTAPTPPTTAAATPPTPAVTAPPATPVAAPVASQVAHDTTPAPRPVPPAPQCGSVANPGAISEIPFGTPSAEAVCVARIWIKAGRNDDAVGALSSSRQAEYPPAMLELAKLYDPRSNYGNPISSADFAKDKYRKAMQKTDDDAVRKEAQQRLDALVKQ
jgi:hypothetical protein